ncbi:MAG TPA: NAD-dependent epimerase/dehydratase family protein [Ignavibacteria bacterium]|nr:NAD-dependent epimerase/dehydratase family protein [Ignavibacteria bacterium]HMR40451.1 NAD-dependent epimerase/dehydratase family protein [Ignavibacteria bacterium]
MQRKERCLVLGGGGFIGSHITEELLDSGYDVTVFDKLNFSRKNLSGFLGRIHIAEGDFNNEIEIENALEGADHVFHLVSSTLPASSNENPAYDVETNLISSLSLFKKCVERKIKKVVFLSSGGTVYGIPETIPVRETNSTNPICSYGIVKKAIEDYLFMFHKIYGLDYFVFRLSNPYGERQNPMAAQGVIPVFMNNAIEGRQINIWGDGEVVRDYIYIKDAVKVLARSLKVSSDLKVLNLSSGTGYSLNQIIDLIREISGKKIKVEYQKGRSIDVPVSILDNTRVMEIFKWTPETGIKDGMSKTYNYLINLK